MALICMGSMCLSFNDLCYVLSMLKTLRRSLWYLSPCTIALCDSMTLNCRSTLTSLEFFRKFSDVNDDSLYNLIISRKLMYTEVQQSMKSFHMADVGLHF